ncbi:GMC family oxidoreductase [Aurantiacibacter flavus]|uniref:GMC family oxidoreductase n=1 Tax=Aurantiacibacter flavus TaxID=3145232 RepID=A0ABV0CT85_9SPHN
MFDVIVIGSGMSGGIAAKELTERGLKTLVLERGNEVVHRRDYNDFVQPWDFPNAGQINEEEKARDYAVQRECYAVNSLTKDFFVKDSDHPYTTPEGKDFSWIRGYHTGGRSIMWGRQTYRLSPMDFEANARDGHGVDWPIRYEDLAPWYSHIEDFIGVSGSIEGLEQLPDGEFLPPWALNDAELMFKAAVESTFGDGRKVIPARVAHLTEAREKDRALGRTQCQARTICERGCSFGAMHSSLTTSLPAAQATGNLTIVHDAIVDSIEYDPVTDRVTGVKVIDRNTKARTTYEAKVIFSCASTIGTASILLNSMSEVFPTGLANSSDQVGRNIMDHLYSLNTVGLLPHAPDTYYFGRRPGGLYIPRFRNLPGQESEEFIRGYGYQGQARRGGGIEEATGQIGIGAELKGKPAQIGPWSISLVGFGEVLPRESNRVTLSPNESDQWGIPLPHIDCEFGDNEYNMIDRIMDDAKAMIEAAGGVVTYQDRVPGKFGLGIHEMGTARMGRNPGTSVLNKWNQAHDVPNLFITDGSAMTSSGCQNPSLTYMALSARAANTAAGMLAEGVL